MYNKIIARSRPIMSVSTDNIMRQSEWRIRQLNHKEMDALYRAFGCSEIWKWDNVYVLYDRYVITSTVTNQVSYNEWHEHDWADTLLKCAMSNPNHTYLTAESLDPIHFSAVSRIKFVATLRIDIDTWKLELEGLKQYCEDLFDGKLKEARLYKAFYERRAPVDKIEAIRRPILDHYGDKRKRLESNIQAAEAHIKELYTD